MVGKNKLNPAERRLFLICGARIG